VKKLVTILFVLIVFAGCISPTPEASPIAKVTITKIINKSTGEPVTDSVITLRWEGPDGKIIRTEHYQNIDNLTTTVTADGRTRLWVSVESPGYLSWGTAIRLKLNKDKLLSFPVELIPLGGQEQG